MNIAIVLAITLCISWRITNSRMGFYLRAIKDSERAARSLGAPAGRIKLYAFMLSAGLTSVAGALYAMMFGFVDPESGLGILISVKILIMAALGGAGLLFGPLVGVNPTMGLDWILKAFIVVVVGGMGNLAGSIAASIFISLLEAYASLWVSPAQAIIVSFIVLILTLLFRPTGLFVPTPK